MPRINWKNVNTGDKAYVAQAFYAHYPSGSVRDYCAHIRFPQEELDGWLKPKAGLPSPAEQWAAWNSCGLHLGVSNGVTLRNSSGHAATQEQVKAFCTANGLELVTVA